MKVKLKLGNVGSAASLDVDREKRMPIFVSDLQQLLLFSQLGHIAPYTPVRWCNLEKFHRLEKVVVLVIENASLYHYCSYESLMPNLKKFSHKLELVTPSAYKIDIVCDLCTVPLTVPQAVKLLWERGSLQDTSIHIPTVFDKIHHLFPVDLELTPPSVSSLPSTDAFPRTQLLLTGLQMIEENYPLPLKALMENKYKGYVLTKDCYKDVTPLSPMFGIDCEMCLTAVNLELTRISLVDEGGSVIYEEFVKPQTPIKDYLTSYSGITAKKMKGVTKQLKDVQEDLRRILPPDAILVGQSLGNDMDALKMMHPYVIDTSVIYNTTGDRKRKTKLQALAQQFLKENIQTNRKGHCSVEDSKASLNLVKLKLKHNLSFGDAVLKNSMSRAKRQTEVARCNYVTSLLEEVTMTDKTALVVSYEDIVNKYCHYEYEKKNLATKRIIYKSKENNELIVNELCESMDSYSYNIAHLRYLDEEIVSDVPRIMTNIDEWIGKIIKTASIPSLHVVIFAGQHETANGCCFLYVINGKKKLDEQEYCEKLHREIMEQLSLRQQESRLTENYARISNTVRFRLKQYNNQVNQLREKINQSSRLNLTTHDETERRRRQIELLQSKGVQMEKMFKEHNLSTTQDRNRLLGDTASWESDDDEIASGDTQKYTVEQLRVQQKQMLQEQDSGLESLSKIISKQKTIAQSISSEVDLQNDIIEDLGDHIDQTDIRVATETRTIGTINRKDNTCLYWIVIILLFIGIIVVSAV
ncbi:hypothetical protein FQA39_LY01784 [Lamprigera yunnana]|nr:hypothetical protein FQA39_LY01784 [Lamprigera yunnana]